MVIQNDDCELLQQQQKNSDQYLNFPKSINLSMARDVNGFYVISPNHIRHSYGQIITNSHWDEINYGCFHFFGW